MRDKLIELIEKGKVCPYGGVCPECEYDKYDLCFAPRLADALIAQKLVFYYWSGTPLMYDYYGLVTYYQLPHATDKAGFKTLLNGLQHA